MWQATGRRDREAAAALIRLMLREAEPNSLINRILLQALLPGMISVAAKLHWGQGGDWEDANEFFSELLSTTWVVLSEWSGQDRPYAVLDLLSAVRCRLRRQLLRSRGHEQQQARLTPLAVSTKNSSGETQLEQLARALIDLHQEGMRAEDVEVLYAHHVLGFSISELAVMTGRDRRALYARRDRGYRRISA
jgi:DNA-directed RNA polymerase specialized sigma24 family protein